MAQPDTLEGVASSGSSLGTEMTRLVSHLARNNTTVLTNLLDPSTVALLSKIGADVTTPMGLAYFIVSVHGERQVLRNRDIRTLLLSMLSSEEASELCSLLQYPAITPRRTLNGIDFDGAPRNLELLERWYGVANNGIETPLEVSETSHKALASHKLHQHQLNAFRKLRQAIADPPCSVLVHMPFGAGKLRLVATAVLDLYRLDDDDRSIIWLAPGAAMCEEAFLELQEVWEQLGSRDTTIFRLYGDHPLGDLQRLRGAIAVIDILQLEKDDNPALEKLGAVTSVAVFADAENLTHPVGAEIVKKMSVGGEFSVVGILASSGAAIPEGPTRSALSEVFPGTCIIATEEELRTLREAGDFADINASVEDLTNQYSESSSTSVPFTVNAGLLDFDQAYVNQLGNNVARNERLLEILKEESTSKGRIIFYATTAEHARLFAGLLPIQGVTARAITAEEAPAARTLGLQRFVSQEEKVLCVHGFLLSGISVPDISVCVMALPCKSRATFLSTIGRLTEARSAAAPTLRLIVTADSQADTGWVKSLSIWSPLNT